jgi:septal ring factor EnvC (AmiA/AmiB activator)
MKLYLLVFTAILFASISFAQETNNNEDNSLKKEFDKLYRISTNYQLYKVINKEKFLNLKQQVLDSLNTAKKLLTEKNNLLELKQETIKKTQDSLNKTKLELETTIQQKDSIFLFGLQLSKTAYNLILWSLILLLLFALLYFIFAFTKNNILTKTAEGDLKNIEVEYEQYRKKATEREQKLRRTLQDKINKQRNS